MIRPLRRSALFPYTTLFRSLGEMIGRLSKAGIRVPGGFATDADAYREFIGQGGLKARIEARLNGLDADDVEALARCGADIRSEEHTSELQSRRDLVCRLLRE